MRAVSKNSKCSTFFGAKKSIFQKYEPIFCTSFGFRANFWPKKPNFIIRQIKQCLANMDQTVMTGMFDRLKYKIHGAKDEGLGCLV